MLAYSGHTAILVTFGDGLRVTVQNVSWGAKSGGFHWSDADFGSQKHILYGYLSANTHPPDYHPTYGQTSVGAEAA